MKKLIAFGLLLTTLGALAQPRPQASAVLVAFESFGSGIDYSTQRLVTDLINESKDRNLIRTTQMSAWGREGDVTYCIHFKDSYYRSEFVRLISSPIKQDFIDLKQRRTRVFVGLTCSDIQQATEQDI